MTKWLLLGLGGILGTWSRYALSIKAHQLLGNRFPFGTFAVNALGCFIIGFVASLAEEKFSISSELKLFLMVGFCGAFTTFSSFILETSNLTKQGDIVLGFLNIILSVICCFALFRLGVALAK